MPAVRTQGIQNPIRVRATITTESGEMVGVTVVNSIRMKVAPGGDCELLTLPIPIQHQANPKAPIKDLYGLKAKMSIEVESKTKDGGKATTTSNVVLVKG